jgi:ribosomal protein L13
VGRFINLTDKRFGRLTVLIRAPTLKKKTMWACKCDCGSEITVRAGSLLSGKTKSCGCLHIEKISTISGLSKTRVHNIWHNMINRCKNPNAQYYGQCGIRVCDEWRDNFMNFYEWAIKHGYNDALTIERIDSAGNYEPENCRWATRVEQQNNISTNKWFVVNGKRMTLSMLAREYGMKISSLRYRLKSGLPIEAAILRRDSN